MASKKLTVAQIIAAKTKRDKFNNKDVEIKSLGGAVSIQKCKFDVVLNAMDSISKDSSMTNVVEVFKELIYKSVPTFRNADLLKEFEIAEPFDIVTEVLELGEIITLGNEVLQLYGFDGMDDDIKN